MQIEFIVQARFEGKRVRGALGGATVVAGGGYAVLVFRIIQRFHIQERVSILAGPTGMVWA